jgi:hypothetical protein
MPYGTVDELRADALWRAGEPQSSSSQFWVKSLEYLNRIQQGLLLGGGIAVGRDLATSAGIYAHLVDLPITDWWWARALGILMTPTTISATATFTAGSTTVTFTPVSATDLDGYRIVPSDTTVLDFMPKVSAHTAGAGTLTMDVSAPASGSTDVVFAKDTVALPSDFLRFTMAPTRQRVLTDGYPIEVGAREIGPAPWRTLSQGAPTRASLTGPQTLAFNSYDTVPYRLEFEYIAMPADLIAGATPILPAHHRACLAVGAAMLMLFDKSDLSRAQNLASEYREMIRRMTQEQTKAMSGSSSMNARFAYRNALGAPEPVSWVYRY